MIDLPEGEEISKILIQTLMMEKMSSPKEKKANSQRLSSPSKKYNNAKMVQLKNYSREMKSDENKNR